MPTDERWWGSNLATTMALAAGAMSLLSRAGGWLSAAPAFLTLAFALESADAILGWMKTTPAKIAALTATTVGGIAISYAPRVPAFIAFAAVCGLWVVALVKTRKRA
jgi:hypothetical protein